MGYRTLALTGIGGGACRRSGGPCPITGQSSHRCRARPMVIPI
jgi:hypothetical protein